MEITESMVYWITRLDGIKDALVCPLILAVLGVIVLLVISFSKSEFTNEKSWSRWLITIILLEALFWIMAGSSVFIPTTKQMCIIKVLPIMSKNEDMQKLHAEVVGLARELIDELKPINNQINILGENDE